MRFWILCLVFWGMGCGDGQLAMLQDDATSSFSESLPSSQNPTTEEEPLPPAFSLPREYAQLLPFHVRMKKHAAVTGVEPQDPMFDLVLRNRYGLGDHNFGQGVGAVLTWSAAKMSVWVRAMQPVCASDAMRNRYPSLPEHLNEFAVAAYGREVNQEDLELVDDAIADVTDPEQRYEAICLAMLSSMEFVGR